MKEENGALTKNVCQMMEYVIYRKLLPSTNLTSEILDPTSKFQGPITKLSSMRQ